MKTTDLCYSDPLLQPSPVLVSYFELAGGVGAGALVSKRAAELAEAALPDDRAGTTSLMGFPSVQSSVNALRRNEV